jgi:hypothetical protein
MIPRDRVDCGPGNDLVYYDAWLDTVAANCERQRGRGGATPNDTPFTQGRAGVRLHQSCLRWKLLAFRGSGRGE